MEYVSEAVKTVLEIDPENFSLEKMLECYHPEDLNRMHDKERLASDFLFRKISPEQIIDYKVVYLNRIMTKSGVTKTILHQAKALSVTDDGRLMKVIGVHTDISYLKAPIDHKVSFISFKYPSYYSQSTNKIGLKEKNEFSGREVEIIDLISKGLSIKEIAEQLYISEHTVKTHRKNILRKADVKNTVHLVTKCIRDGII
ncbi:LuxR C-terminal-related transcriptional regulator [Lutimonas zeaxanthinifaciens]|uniref:LuxR C-terminal-related transcriptional regulator n=1 Tax=Lutimonas zeaxanthinifaciens TaxID=3060215 RepID=UPI00265D1FA4|nr:LuxR C-terminal-related transcriptional regulator [Lutimonas sp. YSD2104]WKK66354.1 LuxR C-terminal-related transcriptional regulator [Lutimonas sp. YSD2104]